MINPDDARIHLHELIDSMPDEQVALVWMTFQSMINTDDDVDGEDEAPDPENI